MSLVRSCCCQKRGGTIILDVGSCFLVSVLFPQDAVEDANPDGSLTAEFCMDDSADTSPRLMRFPIFHREYSNHRFEDVQALCVPYKGCHAQNTYLGTSPDLLRGLCSGIPR